MLDSKEPSTCEQHRGVPLALEDPHRTAIVFPSSSPRGRDRCGRERPLQLHRRGGGAKAGEPSWLVIRNRRFLIGRRESMILVDASARGRSEGKARASRLGRIEAAACERRCCPSSHGNSAEVFAVAEAVQSVTHTNLHTLQYTQTQESNAVRNARSRVAARSSRARLPLRTRHSTSLPFGTCRVERESNGSSARSPS
jgi:hypothetical protein